MGHYTGLMHFGREVMGTNNIPVFAMPKMTSFLQNNGPWSQLVTLEYIRLQKLKKDDITKIAGYILIKNCWRLRHLRVKKAQQLYISSIDSFLAPTISSEK